MPYNPKPEPKISRAEYFRRNNYDFLSGVFGIIGLSVMLLCIGQIASGVLNPWVLLFPGLLIVASVVTIIAGNRAYNKYLKIK